jgi:CheY-like chemotaxis protein
MRHPLTKYEKMNILIIEDDFANYCLITEFLMPYRFNFYRATNDIETLKLLFTNRIYDLILIELKVSSNRSTGIELIKAIKITFPNIPIIVQTTDVDCRKQLNAILGESDYFIGKPYSIDYFTEKVFVILDSSLS